MLNSTENDKVLEFYKVLPFNYYASIEQQVQSVHKKKNLFKFYNIDKYLSEKTLLLDVGCGSGWLANAAQHFLNCNVTGIDFNPVAIERAQDVANHMNLSTHFHVENLFAYSPVEKFDFVNSLGVLHHTHDCIAAVRSLCQNCIKNDGYFHLGLYHTYGRAPFLNYFKQLKKEGLTEDELYKKYKELHPTSEDETFLRSWFRDQVLHPHETQHTFQEISQILDEEGMSIIHTSINKFEPILDIQQLIKEEVNLEHVGQQALKQTRYFPGFFTILSQKHV